MFEKCTLNPTKTGKIKGNKESQTSLQCDTTLKKKL